MRVSQVWPEFFFISRFQRVEIERHDPREIFHIIPVALNVAFEFRERNVIRIESEEAESFERPGNISTSRLS